MILLVRQDGAHVDKLVIVANARDEPVLVSADVEHRERFARRCNGVGVRVHLPYLLKVASISLHCILVPMT